MDNFKIGMSLRYKLMIVLSCLPIVCLALYLFMATNLFKQDKVAYVFDSSVTLSRSIATQTRIEIETLFDSLRPICETFDFEKKEFPPIAQALFDKQRHVLALVFYQKDANGTFVKIGSLMKDPQKGASFVNNNSILDTLRNAVLQQTSYLEALPQFPNSVGVSFHAGTAGDPHESIVIALYTSEDLLGNFETEGLYRTYLTQKNGHVTLGPDSQMVLGDVAARLNSPLPEGTAEMKGTDKQDYLVSYASTGIGDLTVVSYVNKNKALKAVEVLVGKSVMFFIALIASTLIISVFASRKLTGTLQELYEATQKIAHGDFNVNVVRRSNDEIGGLAESFTWMADEVSRLMSETAEQARMANELATVKTVQETLFPAGNLNFGPVTVVGNYEPASECGGDWWSCSHIGDKVYLWIGDATGHGAPAALITSAARSAAAVIETFENVTPSLAMRTLNHAIHQTSKGKINMTFFIGCLDLNTGAMTYASASHDPPYWMQRRPGQKLKKKDLTPLMNVNGPRLGEQPDTIYEEATIQLEAGDLIFFYTDGIIDIQNPAEEKWGERIFLRTLIESANGEGGASEIVTKMRQIATEYRRGAVLVDDVTMFMVEFNPAQEVKEAS